MNISRHGVDVSASPSSRLTAGRTTSGSSTASLATRAIASFLASRGIELPFGSPDDPEERETVCGLGNRKNRYFLETLERTGADSLPDDHRADRKAARARRTYRDRLFEPQLRGRARGCRDPGALRGEGGRPGRRRARARGQARPGALPRGRAPPRTSNRPTRRWSRTRSRASRQAGRAASGSSSGSTGRDSARHSRPRAPISSSPTWARSWHERLAPRVRAASTRRARACGRRSARSATAFSGPGAPRRKARADGVHYPATYAAGVYNRLPTTVAGLTLEDESIVNLPNWLPLTFRAEDGCWLEDSRVPGASARARPPPRRAHPAHPRPRRRRPRDSADAAAHRLNGRPAPGRTRDDRRPRELVGSPAGSLAPRRKRLNSGVARYRDAGRRSPHGGRDHSAGRRARSSSGL